MSNYPKDITLQECTPNYTPAWYKSFEKTVCKSLFQFYGIKPTKLKQVMAKQYSDEYVQLTIAFEHFGILYELELVSFNPKKQELNFKLSDIRVSGKNVRISNPIKIPS